MDAYSNYIMKLSDARVGELRRQAAEYATSRKSRHGRSRFRLRLRRTTAPVAAPVRPVRDTAVEDERELSPIA